MTDYEQQFRTCHNVCGEAFEEIVAFFESFNKKRAKVLDLGCGQGRDALVAARQGHRVVGVDVSQTGISQMVEQARAERLNITGVVADVVTFKPRGAYDVVVLDRVLHLLGDDDKRSLVLEKACRHTRRRGYILIADTPKHSSLIRGFFAKRTKQWSVVLSRKNFLFVQNMGQQSRQDVVHR